MLLHKKSGKFGVLLCYGGDEQSDVSVFVGDVEENSAADINGKIMVGDQIVQVIDRLILLLSYSYQSPSVFGLFI